MPEDALGSVIVLAAGGVLLIIGEIFVPGGIVGTIGGILLGIAIVMGFLIDPSIGAALLVGSLIFGLVSFWLWVKFFPKTRVGRSIILQNDAGTWDGYSKVHSELIGKQGTTHTSLHPGGIAMIDGKRVDVVTRGELVDRDKEVEVITVEGNRIVVTEVE